MTNNGLKNPHGTQGDASKDITMPKNNQDYDRQSIEDMEKEVFRMAERGNLFLSKYIFLEGMMQQQFIKQRNERL
jgi:hypothetical protein